MGIEVGTALLISSVLAGGAAVASGVQSYQAGKAQKEQADADASAREGASRVEAERIRKITERQRASARAALAGSGVNVDQGTALDIDADINQRGEQDALTAILQGTYDARSLRAGGRMAAMQGRNALVVGGLEAGSSLAAGKVGYGKWQKQQGALG